MIIFKNIVSKLALILLLIALVLMTSRTGHAAEKFIVRMIYFKSQEAPPVDHDKYDKIMRDMQDFFRKEMIRHGYGDKTFKYEKDNEGKLKIHSFTGKHDANHYTGEVFLAWYEKIRKEIPFHLNSATNRDEQENIYIIIYGGIPIIGDGRGSPDGGGWTFSGTATGGSCAINENYEKKEPDRYTSLIAHEFAHTFALKHNDHIRSLMQTIPLGGPSFITEYEARLLNKLHFFNDIHKFNDPPKVGINDIKTKAEGPYIVIFYVPITGSADLYHLQLDYAQGYLGYAELEGRNIIAEVRVPRYKLLDAKILSTLGLFVIDINGNKRKMNIKNIVIPEPEETKPTNIFDVKNPDLGIDDDKEEDQEVTEVDEKDDEEKEQEPRNVTAKHKLTTIWAKMKARQ